MGLFVCVCFEFFNFGTWNLELEAFLFKLFGVVRLEEGTTRRRALNRDILARSGGEMSRVSNARPSSWVTCTLQGRRAHEFAGGVFQEFCHTVACLI